jgi:hypothetical protein
MNRSKSFLVFTLVLLMLGFSTLASAVPITTFVATISVTDPTQLGRLSRNGIPQDWSGGEAYPGWMSAATSYHYSVYTLPGSWFDFGAGGYAGYVQVSIDSVSTISFGAAYLNSYNPSTPAATWLGDAGSSGNYFGVDPLFFQVILPKGDDLLLVFNNVGASDGGVGDRLGILVEGFVDTEYTDPSPVPEPASLLLLGTGVLALGGRLRRRLHKVDPVV